MDNLNENKFLIINTKITIFDNLIKELKDKINSNNNEDINLYFRKLYNKDNEKYHKMIVHIIYNKKIKNIKKFGFNIILDDNFPKSPPKIYCDYLDNNLINTNLNDRRDLLISIIEKNWMLYKQNFNNINILENLILIKIPKFISRLLYYEENHVLIYYGKYYLNEIYNINNFLVNKKIFLFKVLTYKTDKNTSKYSELNNKYIIVTDIYILFFDLLDDKTQNFAKLIFIGEIFQFNSIERLDIDVNNNNLVNQNNNINEENNILNIEPQKIYIDWIINEKNYSFIFSIKNEIYDSEKKNIIKNNTNNEIIDFIDIVNKKQNYISSKYKLVINDYNQIEFINVPLIESIYESNNNFLYHLIDLAKYLEKSQKKKINKKNDLKNDNDIYNCEINKIYNKIIDIATKNNKIEITFDFLDKLQIIKNKKRIFHNNEDEEQKKDSSSPINNNKINPKKIINENNFKIEKKCLLDEKNKIKTENNNKIININNLISNNDNCTKEKIDINNAKGNNIHGLNQKKDNKTNSFEIKNKVNNKIEINKINNKIETNDKSKINYNKKINKSKNSISALIQMFENKKD